jgi:uncharacterized membrane protein
MSNLVAAAAVFLAVHFFISGTQVRDVLVRAMGEKPYMGAFSLLSIVVLVWMAMAFNTAGAAPGSAADPYLYDLGVGARHAAPLVVMIAFLLGVPGLFTPNPTSVNREGLAGKAGVVRGVLRVTRHPFLWGVALWSADHLTTNGDMAAVVFFGTFFLLAIFGTVSIDAKRKRKLGPAWDAFAAETSNLPFGAILSGRNRFSVREYFDWRFAVALALFVALLFAHVHIFGVSPFA